MNNQRKERKCEKCHVKDCNRDSECNAPVKEYCPALIHPEPKEDSEERFDRLLLELLGQSDFSNYLGSFHCAKIKSFISQERIAVREQVIKEVVEIIKDYRFSRWNDEQEIYDQVEDIIEALSKLKK